MHTIFIYECSPGCLTLSFVKSDYVRDSVGGGRISGCRRSEEGPGKGKCDEGIDGGWSGCVSALRAFSLALLVRLG